MLMATASSQGLGQCTRLFERKHRAQSRGISACLRHHVLYYTYV